MFSSLRKVFVVGSYNSCQHQEKELKTLMKVKINHANYYKQEKFYGVIQAPAFPDNQQKSQTPKGENLMVSNNVWKM